MMAILFIIAYMLVKSFPASNGSQQPSALIRIGVVPLGPIVWNAAVLLVLFMISLVFGPTVESARFGSVIAFIAHRLACLEWLPSSSLWYVACVIAMGDDLTLLQWFLERWGVRHAFLGLVAVIAIQRAIHKVFIAVLLTREFKHDESNRAWRSGKWSGRGFGRHVVSQPASEFIVKIIELSI